MPLHTFRIVLWCTFFNLTHNLFFSVVHNFFFFFNFSHATLTRCCDFSSTSCTFMRCETVAYFSFINPKCIHTPNSLSPVCVWRLFSPTHVYVRQSETQEIEMVGWPAQKYPMHQEFGNPPHYFKICSLAVACNGQLDHFYRLNWGERNCDTERWVNLGNWWNKK